MTTCEDCGSKVYSGYCINCNEEHFIEQQYNDLNIEVPEVIYVKSRKDDEEAIKRNNKCDNFGNIKENNGSN